MADRYLGCRACIHREGIGCKAFPARIRLDILSGQTKHDSVIEGQVGDFVYEAESKAAD